MIIDKEELKFLKGLERTVFVTGCFNLFHPGHAHFLKMAKRYGRTLVVAVAHDEITSIKREPILNQVQRMYIVNSHKSVSYVVPEDNRMPPNNISDIVKRLEPTFWVTNTDNPNLDTYKELIKSIPTIMYTLERRTDGLFDISTTSIINNMVKQYLLKQYNNTRKK